MTKLPHRNSIHTIVFDFDGIFTDNKVWVSEDGSEIVRCDRGDGLGLDIFRNFCNYHQWTPNLFILSKEKNPVVESRAKKLKLKCYQSVDSKLKHIEAYLRRSSLEWQGLVYLGNDLNDYVVMLKAGYSVAPIDAHPRILEVADLVLLNEGGNGFVRAFLEKLMKLSTLSPECLAQLV
jgi:3-deoxy-D-manno-octulosonate 8-phosphate phosphatase (KDO 8-P phosphatase)